MMLRMEDGVATMVSLIIPINLSNFILTVECPFQAPYRFGSVYHADGTEIKFTDKVLNDLNRPGKTKECCFTREFNNTSNEWICRNKHSLPCKRRTENFGDPKKDSLCATNELAISFKLNTLETVIDEGNQS